MEGFILGSEPRTQRTRSTVAVFSIALLCSACASSPDSGWTPFQAAFVNPAQLFSEDTDVYGLRISFPYGKNAKVYGIDFGIAGSAKSVAGLQYNLAYNRAEDFWGSQLSIFYNGAENVSGSQISWFANQAEDAVGFRLAGLPGNLSTNFSGLEVGGINRVDELVKGVQLGTVNRAGELKGVQLAGVHNRSESVVGLQITAGVNETENLRGVQIGVLNFNRNGVLPFFPIINIGFGSSNEEATASDE